MQSINSYLDKWSALDIKQKEISWELGAIVSTSALGQHPECFDETAENLVKIMKQKAEIWNQIRNYIVPGTLETLWNLALKSDENILKSNENKVVKQNCIFSVNYYGSETGCSFTANNIKSLIGGN